MEYLVLLLVQHCLVLKVLSLDVIDSLEQLLYADDFVPDILKKRIEVLLKVCMLISDNVSPLNCHVVQEDIRVVESVLFFAWHPIVHVPEQSMKVSKHVTHPIQSVCFVNVQILQSLAAPGDFLVESLCSIEELVDFFSVCLVLQVEFEVYSTRSCFERCDCFENFLIGSFLFEILKLTLVCHV